MTCRPVSVSRPGREGRNPSLLPRQQNKGKSTVWLPLFIMADFYVYILQSEKTGRCYCGQTQDLNDRLERHNSGRSKATSRERPWIVVKTFGFATRSEAEQLERKIKKRGIKRFLNDMQSG